MIQKMLGIYIQERREDLRLTPAQVKKMTGIAPARLRMIEAGSVAIKPQTLEALQTSLGLDEHRIETISKVAKVGFINNLMNLVWSEAESSEELRE